MSHDKPMPKGTHLARSVLLLLSVYFAAQTFGQGAQSRTSLPPYINGITFETPLELDDRHWGRLGEITTPVVIRVVFGRDTEPELHRPVLQKLHSLTLPGGRRKVYVLGELLDSDFLARYRWECDKTPGCTFDESDSAAYHDYKTRINRYVDALDEWVDIWEVGNEVNGEWADESCVKDSDDSCRYKKVGGKRVPLTPARPDITADKIRFAIDKVKEKKKPVALTLMHMPECITWSDNTMFEWAEANLKSKLGGVTIDYLLVSYYEDNCDKGKLTIVKEDSRRLPEQNRRSLYWNGIFDQLAGLFADVEADVKHVGFGEIGYSSDTVTCPKDELSFCDKETKKNPRSKLTILNRYHGLQIYTPEYLGGHFWWTAQEDILYDGFYSALKSNFKAVVWSVGE